MGSVEPPVKLLRTPRAAGVAGILAALLVVSTVTWSELLFPVRVLVVGCFLLASHRRRSASA
ncbi:hypothetical protein [Nonomuraea dietziae]|uniref:Uncharacterized protein n=1 Tax=Nonomuraea dietziae TaxID=65515 RepID=A0A7W5V3R9_9ACTN|nr:hypothetical protein [Nonomuraea dietziae]MBB3724290.1 hypothetical protein [Nonomuraea dietziae]